MPHHDLRLETLRQMRRSLNEEVIFNVCQKYLPQRIATVDRISRDLSV